MTLERLPIIIFVKVCVTAPEIIMDAKFSKYGSINLEKVGSTSQKKVLLLAERSVNGGWVKTFQLTLPKKYHLLRLVKDVISIHRNNYLSVSLFCMFIYRSVAYKTYSYKR